MSNTLEKPSRNEAGPTVYDDKFFENLESGSLNSARAIVPIVLELVAPRTVVDVGCGRGAWLRAFIENGISDVHGLDGAYVKTSELLIPQDRFRPIDLSRPFTIDRKFDLAMCLEVGEHLPHRSARAFVDSLTKAAPLVLFSAAVPGQRGTRHINEQWPAYWQRLFEEFGYVRLDPIRRRVIADNRVEWWYRQNIYLFAAEATVAASELLRSEQSFAAENPMEIVHADILGGYQTLNGLVHQIPGVLSRAARRILGI